MQKRILLALATAMTIGTTGVAFAQPDDHPPPPHHYHHYRHHHRHVPPPPPHDDHPG